MKDNVEKLREKEIRGGLEKKSRQSEEILRSKEQYVKKKERKKKRSHLPFWVYP